MSDSGMKDMDRLLRFLCFGSESYFKVCSPPVGPVPAFLMNLLGDGRGEEVVQEVVRCHGDRRYVTRVGLLVTLAVCVRTECQRTKQAAFRAVQEICELPTDLLGFVHHAMSVAESQKGWGRAMRAVVDRWYNARSGRELATLTTRFKSTAGWSHVDLLRLSHIKGANPGVAVVLKYLAKGLDAAKQLATDTPGDDVTGIVDYLQAVDTVKHTSDAQLAARLIEQHHLTRQHVPTPLLQSTEVWTALVSELPLGELLSSFGKLTSLGLLQNDSQAAGTVISRLTDSTEVKTSGINPLSVLVAQRVYEHNISKNKEKLTLNKSIMDALDMALASALTQNVRKTNQRYLLAVRVGVNESRGKGTHRGGAVRGTEAVSPLFAAASIMHVIASVESQCELVSFTSDVTPISVSNDKKHADICKSITEASSSMETGLGRCDLGVPIRWAEQQKRSFDVIIVLTDSRNSTGQPADALRQYRAALSLPQTRLVVCALTASQLSPVDVSDRYILDIAGFSPTVGPVISHFVSGAI